MSDNIRKRPRGRPKAHFSVAPPKPVQALDRGLVLLHALAEAGGASLTDLSLRVALPPSSVHRILATLEKHGFAVVDEATQQWYIGVEAFRTGNAFLARSNIVETARDVMRQLMEETGETANLAIADGFDVVFVGQIESHNPIRAFFNPGTRGAMHASGIGKALLAELPRASVEKLVQTTGLPDYTDNTLTTPARLFANLEKIRKRGWALDDEERYAGMRCVAASIHNAFGEAVAGISVSGPAVRFSEQQVANFGPRVKKAAAQVTRRIGGRLSL